MCIIQDSTGHFYSTLGSNSRINAPEYNSKKISTAEAVAKGCTKFNVDGTPDMRTRENRALFGPGPGLNLDGKPDMRCGKNREENNKKILSDFN